MVIIVFVYSRDISRAQMSASPDSSPRLPPTARRRADTSGGSAPAGDEARASGSDTGGGGHEDGANVKKDKEEHERLKHPYVAIGETMRLSEQEKAKTFSTLFPQNEGSS